MTAIRAVFDGKAFVPLHPVSLPVQSEALVLVDAIDAAAQHHLDEAVREYYQSAGDADDAGWSRAINGQSHRAWDED